MGIFPSYKLSRDVLTVFEKVVDEDPIGINSPVAFFLTFTRYQYANVIPVFIHSPLDSYVYLQSYLLMCIYMKEQK